MAASANNDYSDQPAIDRQQAAIALPPDQISSNKEYSFEE